MRDLFVVLAIRRSSNTKSWTVSIFFIESMCELKWLLASIAASMVRTISQMTKASTVQDSLLKFLQ